MKQLFGWQLRTDNLSRLFFGWVAGVLLNELLFAIADETFCLLIYCRFTIAIVDHPAKLGKKEDCYSKYGDGFIQCDKNKNLK